MVMWYLCQEWHKLPQHVLADILNRLEDAKDVAIAQCVSLGFYKAGQTVRTLRFVVLDSDHESARSKLPDPRLSELPYSRLSKLMVPNSTLDMFHQTLGLGYQVHDSYEVFRTLKRTRGLVKLHIEVEPKLQEKTVSEDEKQRTDFWFADNHYWYTYDDRWASSLQSLSIVDYGKQSIPWKSNIIYRLGMCCGQFLILQLSTAKSTLFRSCNLVLNHSPGFLP